MTSALHGYIYLDTALKGSPEENPYTRGPTKFAGLEAHKRQKRTPICGKAALQGHGRPVNALPGAFQNTQNISKIACFA
jgi:hypothetical protein